jgi:hypothetical protein
MNFTEAIARLLKGERIRCVKWHPYYFIEYDKEGVHEYCNDVDRDIICYTDYAEDYQKLFSLDDVLSDWEIYKEKLSKNNDIDNTTAFRPGKLIQWREPNIETVKQVEIGDKVKFRYLDGTVIDVTVVEFDDGNVIGVSKYGRPHWCPMKDVIVEN